MDVAERCVEDREWDAEQRLDPDGLRHPYVSSDGTGGEATEDGCERDRRSTLAGLEGFADSMADQSANDVERDPERASEHAFTHDTHCGTQHERCEYYEDGAIALDQYRAQQSPHFAGSQCPRIAPKCMGNVRAEEPSRRGRSGCEQQRSS